MRGKFLDFLETMSKADSVEHLWSKRHEYDFNSFVSD